MVFATIRTYSEYKCWHNPNKLCHGAEGERLLQRAILTKKYEKMPDIRKSIASYGALIAALKYRLTLTGRCVATTKRWAWRMLKLTNRRCHTRTASILCSLAIAVTCAVGRCLSTNLPPRLNSCRHNPLQNMGSRCTLGFLRI